jgi:hypothetical protein
MINSTTKLERKSSASDVTKYDELLKENYNFHVGLDELQLEDFLLLKDAPPKKEKLFSSAKENSC